MARFLVHRLAWVVLTLLGVLLVTFTFTYIIPADPARAMAGPHASEATVENIRHQLGLDKPFWARFTGYLGKALRGDLGYSFQTHQSVMTAVASRLPATASLALAGVVAELLLGLPIGVACALKENTLLDRLLGISLVVGVAAPPFWIGLMLMWVLAYLVPIFPLGGSGPAAIVLPALTVGLSGSAYYARLMKNSLHDVLRQDYIRTAKAKGMHPARVVVRHAMRNALIPIITMLGMDLGYFMGGVVVVEAVFGWPGIGLQAYQAISYMDIPMINGTVFVAALAIVMANVLVDVVYTVVNPIIRIK